MSVETFVGSWVRLSCTNGDANVTWAIVSGPVDDSGRPAGKFDESSTCHPLFRGHKAGSYVVEATQTVENKPSSEFIEINVADFQPRIELAAGSNHQITLNDGSPPTRQVAIQHDELIDLDGSKSRGPKGFRYIWTVEDTRNHLEAKIFSNEGLATVNPRTSRTQAQRGESSFRVNLQLIAEGLNGKGQSVEIWSSTSTIQVTVQAATASVAQRLTPPEEEHWTEYRDKLHYESLANARKAATTWQGALAALAALVGTIVFVAAPDDLTEINTTWVKKLVLISLVVAVAGAVVSWLMFQAVADETPEYGESKPSNFDYAATYETNVENATKRIGLGKFAASIAFIAFVLGTFLLMGDSVLADSSDDSEAPGSFAIVITETGSVLCGAIETVDGQLSLNGSTVLDAVSYTAVDNCPGSAESEQSTTTTTVRTSTTT